MEVLHQFGTPEQQERWLRPLLDGEIRSAFAMTEPDVASSDATNIAMRIERDGDEYVLNGRKWWTTGRAAPPLPHPHLMGKTDPDGRHLPAAVDGARTRSTRRASTVERSTAVFGYTEPEGHGELPFDDVRVPVDEHPRRRGRRASRSPRPGSDRAGSTTACGRSARPSARSS